jgi:nicotinamidase-related amidase
MRVIAELYQQFDADPSLPVPAEAYGGWCEREIELAPVHTALVVMHAWDAGPPGAFPGWRRAVEYLPRAEHILNTVFPPLLAAVRASPIRVFHVCGNRSDELSADRKPAARRADVRVRRLMVDCDPVHQELRRVRAAHAFPGAHNRADIEKALARLDFAPTARPIGHEGVAADGDQLATLCRIHGINHLIYVGFAINWCLLMAPGGMVDMARHGCLCSTIREAVTAVENRETARDEREKQQALWRVAVEFGFVFRLDPFLRALPARFP